jgi:AbrB family looped-hinge helix DNA binding protein
VNVFTEGLPEVSFSASLDSKGRITVPARIRNKLDLEKGDEISLILDSDNLIRKSFSSKSKALEYISSLEDVKSFSFDGEVLEAVLDGS